MSFLKQLQTDLVGRLLSCPDFDNVDVRRQESTGEKQVNVLRDNLNKSLGGLRKGKGGKAGLAVLVMMPTVRVDRSTRDLPGPQLLVQCPVQILENEEINRGAKGAQIPAENLGFTTLALGHLWQPRPGTLLYADETAMEPLETDGEMLATVAYQVNLSTPLGTTPFVKCVTPRIIIHEGMATILAASGERVFYTLNEDAFPWQGEPSAVQYDTPFQVTPGQVIRAAAYAERAVGSDVAQETVA